MTVRLLPLTGLVLAGLACVAPESRVSPEQEAAAPESQANPEQETVVLSEPGVCAREAESVVEEPAVVAENPVNAPGHFNETVRLPPNTILTSGWSGELLIDRTGRVVRVWPTGQSSTSPAGFPIDTLMVKAMLAWRYQPVLSSGRAVPACLGLVIFIN